MLVSLLKEGGFWGASNAVDDCTRENLGLIADTSSRT
jgi:hypothetical protein